VRQNARGSGGIWQAACRPFKLTGQWWQAACGPARTTEANNKACPCTQRAHLHPLPAQTRSLPLPVCFPVAPAEYSVPEQRSVACGVDLPHPVRFPVAPATPPPTCSRYTVSSPWGHRAPWPPCPERPESIPGIPVSFPGRVLKQLRLRYFQYSRFISWPPCPEGPLAAIGCPGCRPCRPPGEGPLGSRLRVLKLEYSLRCPLAPGWPALAAPDGASGLLPAPVLSSARFMALVAPLGGAVAPLGRGPIRRGYSGWVCPTRAGPDSGRPPPLPPPPLHPSGAGRPDEGGGQ
jgi:hypothetical protein